MQLRLGPYWLLLDCGLGNISPLLNTPESKSWSAVLCSHAHSDHGRGLQALHAAVPDLPIFASEVTARLLPLSWLTNNLVEAPTCNALPWRSPIQIQPNLSVTLLPAGHLPGAASMWLSYATRGRDYTVLYTGDFFLSNSRLVESLPLDEFRGLAPDVLVIEGTFGTARHPHRRSQENQLAGRIHEAIAAGQSVILPVPKIGIAQEILMLLRSHHHFTGQDIDIWVDTEVARGCDIYLELLPYLPASIQNFAQHQPLFWDERVRPRVRRVLDRRSLDPLTVSQPCILMVDRSPDWQINWANWISAWSDSWLVLLPEGSQSLKQEGYLTVPHQTYLLADHSDVSGTTQLIHNLKPQHVVFIHGNANNLSDLANLDELRNRYHVHCPSVGTRLELPIDESLHFSMPPRDTLDRLRPYEGELAELDAEVMLTLPAEIASDSRWLNFSDTGLIEARWQGEELVIRGISQRELLSAEPASFSDVNLHSCGTCRHLRSLRCHNPESPLYGLKVSRDGYCPAFESDRPDIG